MSVRPPKPIKLLSFLKENLMQKRHIKYVFHLNDVWTIWCCWPRRSCSRYYLDIVHTQRVSAKIHNSKCYMANTKHIFLHDVENFELLAHMFSLASEFNIIVYKLTSFLTRFLNGIFFLTWGKKDRKSSFLPKLSV